MSDRFFSKEQKYYGGEEHRPPEVLFLNAGPIQCQYESGYLRYIKAGGIEVIRMIYPAVRDANWNTIHAEIRNEKIINAADHFEISYDCLYEEGEIAFQANYQILGSFEGEISFSLTGECLQSFLKNRIGFNVLHPPEVAGSPIKVEYCKGAKEEGRFPVYISPQQTFLDIKNMRWKMGNTWAKLEFEGDIFEMEDQRNWTDASYKTYCTPLAIPFPARLEKGEQIHQSVKLSFENLQFTDEEVSQKIELEVGLEKYPLPQLGIGQSSEIQQLSEKESTYIRKLSFTHYRVDIHLNERNLERSWWHAVDEAKQLDLPLELSLYFGAETAQQLGNLMDLLEISKPEVRKILLFSEDKKCTPAQLIQEVLPDVKSLFPEAQIGGGTDCFFTELNRVRVDPKSLDFLSYSINPQVHQFDNQSLVETLQAQKYTVESAKLFSGNLPIHISPVSLKMRFNPNATGPVPDTPEGALPPQVDSRQMSIFGAGWTIGSIKYLASAGVKAITYYETVGRRGIMQGEQSPVLSEKFKSLHGMLFPMYWVFYTLLLEKNIQLLATRSSAPHQVECLAWEALNRQYMFVVNYQHKTIDVEVKKWIDHFEVKVLSNESFEKMVLHFDAFISSDWETSNNSLKLSPYGIYLLRETI